MGLFIKKILARYEFIIYIHFNYYMSRFLRYMYENDTQVS